jgi:transposase
VLCAAEQDRPDVAERRDLWRAERLGIPVRRLVFIDETSASTRMARLRGRSERGKRLIAKVPHGHWKTTTFVAALRSDGLTAPVVVDGAMNGEIFLSYVRTQLIPALQPGDVVVMDNLAAHKVAGVREAIESAGATVVYLPPYSPDFNPIELLFSKLKSLLRRDAARTVQELWDLLAKLVPIFTPEECTRYFKHCGYRNAATTL